MRSEPLPEVQIARAIAAMLVVVSHACLLVARSTQGREWLNMFAPFGSFGVHIFFVISGLIMYHTAGREFGVSGSSIAFMRRRLVRVVPLYWIVTTFAAILYTIAALDDPGKHLKIYEIVGSYLFLPYDYSDGRFRPILGVGWTLDYEMFFYALFAISLLFRRGLTVVFLIMASLTALGTVLTGAPSALMAFTRPILLLFLFGIAIGMLRERTAFRIEGRWTFTVMAVIAIAARLLPIESGERSVDWMPWSWFLAILVVSAAAFAAEHVRGKVSRFGGHIGDASYSLYLVHPMVISVGTLALAKMGLKTDETIIAYACAVPFISLAVSFVSYRLIERPTARLLTFRT